MDATPEAISRRSEHPGQYDYSSPVVRDNALILRMASWLGAQARK
jgi:hypothetical protein